MLYPVKALLKTSVGQWKQPEISWFDSWDTRWHWRLQRRTFQDNQGLFAFSFFRNYFHLCHLLQAIKKSIYFSLFFKEIKTIRVLEPLCHMQKFFQLYNNMWQSIVIPSLGVRFWDKLKKTFCLLPRVCHNMEMEQAPVAKPLHVYQP